MDNKKQGISNIGAVKQADKDTLSNSEKSGDAGKAHNLNQTPICESLKEAVSLWNRIYCYALSHYEIEPA